jgi:hypothetical protein
MGEVFRVVFGSLLVALPFVLVVLAWRSLHWAHPIQVPWRKRLFAVALVGTALSYLWFWLVFLALPRTLSFQMYENVGRSSQGLALAFLILAFAGVGLARLFAVAAALGVAVLWMTIGVY